MPRLVLENTFAERLAGAHIPQKPQGFPAPELVVLNQALAQDLAFPDLTAQEAAALFSGSDIAAASRPVAQVYAGHQFGAFSPQLGDGRALLLGEWLTPDGRRVDIHLKGSGPTPFSRGGDGRATLGPVLREYLMGEGMHRLGIATTRVLAAVRTGETVLRGTPLPGAVLARTASSHLRVGTLQYFAARRDHATLARVVDYALERHFPDQAGSNQPAAALLSAVAQRQGELIASWMLVGFIHGVMNTDNMTLSGETIDYGPCAFMDVYDPATVFSSIDHYGRYAYGNQPDIGLWNLARMGEALLPLLDADKSRASDQVEAALALYKTSYEAHHAQGMRNKLGLRGEEADDEALISALLSWMQATQQDYTQAFRQLARGLESAERPFDDDVFATWYQRYEARLGQEARAAVAQRMNAHNPVYIPRNHLVEEALSAALDGDLMAFEVLLRALEQPFEPRPGLTRYERPAPDNFGPYQTFCGT